MDQQQTDHDNDSSGADDEPGATFLVAVPHLSVAQGLPEVGQDEPEIACEFAPGTIESFKSADGRTMRVVWLGDERGLAAKPVVRE